MVADFEDQLVSSSNIFLEDEKICRRLTRCYCDFLRQSGVFGYLSRLSIWLVYKRVMWRPTQHHADSI